MTKKEICGAIIGIGISLFGLLIGGNNYTTGFISMWVAGFVMDYIVEDDEDEACECCCNNKEVI
ncbi:MAG: hypothetical protein WCX48_10575 [Bacteroidales bacterium]